MQSFLNLRKKVSGETPPPEALAPLHSNPHLTKVEAAHGQPGEPKVELITEGGMIRTIVVNCKCGERIELKCHY